MRHMPTPARTSTRSGRQARDAARMRGMRKDRRAVGAPAYVPDLRRHALLRLVAQPPRQQACARRGHPSSRRPSRASGGCTASRTTRLLSTESRWARPRDHPRSSMAIQVRKGQGDVKLTREEFERRLRQRFYDPRVRRTSSARSPRSSTSPGRRTTSTTRARARGRPAPASPIPSSSCRSNGSRRASGFSRPSASRRTPTRPGRVLLVCGAARHDQTCPGEMSKTFRLASLAREEVEQRRPRVRLPRPQPAHRRVRPPDSSLQGLRLDRDAALPLAVLLLPEPRAGPGATTG